MFNKFKTIHLDIIFWNVSGIQALENMKDFGAFFYYVSSNLNFFK